MPVSCSRSEFQKFLGRRKRLDAIAERPDQRSGGIPDGFVVINN